MADTRVTLCGVPIANPVIPASGVFGYGHEFAQLYDIDRLGTFSCKGTTLAERFGNATPRVAECAAGMLNSVGLQNPGVRRVIDEELPRLKPVFHKPMIANVSGFSIDEYAETCALMDKEEQVGWLEVNISCPNVHGGGMSFGTTPEGAAAVTRAVKAVTRKPVIVKLTPNVTDIASIAKACEEAGADGLCLINTLLGMRVDTARRRPVLANTFGGLSGDAIFPIALRMVWQVYEAVRIPIIGCGGVSTARQMIEMLLAGATAVEIGAANLTDPWVCAKLVDELPSAMDACRLENWMDNIGGAHR